MSVEEFFLQLHHPEGGCLVVLVFNPNLHLVISMLRSDLLAVEFCLVAGLGFWLGGSTSITSSLQSEQSQQHLSHFKFAHFSQYLPIKLYTISTYLPSDSVQGTVAVNSGSIKISGA